MIRRRTQLDIMRERLRPCLSIDVYEAEQSGGDPRDRGKVVYVDFDWLGLYASWAFEIMRPKKAPK